MALFTGEIHGKHFEINVLRSGSFNCSAAAGSELKDLSYIPS